MNEVVLNSCGVDPGPCEDTSIEEYHAPSIEESMCLEAAFPGVIERYFNSLYLLDYRGCCHDYRLLQHSNGLVVVLLAPSHPLLQQPHRISAVDFQVTNNTNRLDNCASGKRKRGAQRMNAESPLLRVLLKPEEAEVGPHQPSVSVSGGGASVQDCGTSSLSAPDQRHTDSNSADNSAGGGRGSTLSSVVVVPACVGGKLIQLNERLTADPLLMVRGAEDGTGFLAIVQPSPRSALLQLRSCSVSISEYHLAVKARCSHPS